MVKGGIEKRERGEEIQKTEMIRKGGGKGADKMRLMGMRRERNEGNNGGMGF